MAVRLGYVYCTGENKIEIKQFEFKWVAGGSLKSNRACIIEIHKVIEESGFGRALDVSVNTEGKLARSLIYKNIWNDIMKDRTILKGKFGNPIYNDDYFTIAAISKNKELSDFVLQFNVFTNISAKPEDDDRSTAKACCLYKYLVSNSLLEIYLEHPDQIQIK